jgi:hypothetical protein
MGNRCYWLSVCEVTVHVLTGGDCLQSHNNVRLFTRQLHWAMQQCKRQLNHEAGVEEETPGKQQSIGAVTVRMRTADEGLGDPIQLADAESKDDDVEIVDMEACTTSTNISDDFAHRGDGLQTMPFYVYRMYVRRILRPGKARTRDATIFTFEEHYPLSRTYAQEVILHNISVPTIDGFQCPTWTEDAEQNSLLKALLFTPWRCLDPLTCGTCENFKHMLSNCTCKVYGAVQPVVVPRGAAHPAPSSVRKFTFERAWRLRCSELHVLAQRADARCQDQEAAGSVR